MCVITIDLLILRLQFLRAYNIFLYLIQVIHLKTIYELEVPKTQFVIMTYVSWIFKVNFTHTSCLDISY